MTLFLQQKVGEGAASKKKPDFVFVERRNHCFLKDD